MFVDDEQNFQEKIFSKIFLVEFKRNKKNFLQLKCTYRSLSSAAWEASESLAVAEPKRSSERSRSSSKS